MKLVFWWNFLSTAHLMISCSHAAPERFKRTDVSGSSGGLSPRAFVPPSSSWSLSSSSGEFRSRTPTPVNVNSRHPGWRKVRASDAAAASATTLYSRSTSDSESLDFEREKKKEEAFLDAIDEISRGTRCLPQYSNQKDVLVGDSRHVFLPKSLQSIEEIPASQWKLSHFATANRVALLASFLSQYKPETDGFKLLRNAMDQLVRLDHNFFRVRMAWTRPPEDNKKSRLLADYFVFLERKRRLSTESYNRSFSLQEPWLQLPQQGKKNQYLHRLLREGSVHISLNTYARDELNFAEWTPVYYSCELRKWLISYTALVVSDSEQIPGSNLYSLRGVVSIDMDISQTDFDQCEDMIEELTEAVPMPGTHKCDRDSSRCIFRPGMGWRTGGYQCECRDGFFSTSSANVFNGTLVESAWRLKNQRNGLAYDMIYTCKKCPEGCDSCTSGSPSCPSASGWISKSSLLVILLVCAAVTLVLVYYAYLY